MLRLTIPFVLWICALVTTCDGCAHMKGGPPPTVAMVPGICVEDLTGGTVKQKEMNLVYDELLFQWQETFPLLFDMDAAEDRLKKNPVTAYFVDGQIACSHMDPGGFPGTMARCQGMWPNESLHFFISRKEKGLHCTALGHELSHLFSFWFLGNADQDHREPKIWGRKGLLRKVEDALGGCQR